METGLLTILGLLIIAAGIQVCRQDVVLIGLSLAIIGVALIIVSRQENNSIK